MTAFNRALTRSRSMTPLTAVEAERARAVGDRVRGELIGALVQAKCSNVPALALARELNVDRNLCQRVVRALDPDNSALDVLCRLPGPEGLRKVVAALDHAAPSSLSATVTAAVDDFDKLVRELGGSHSRLLARLETARRSASGGSDPTIGDREFYFHAGAKMLGYSVETCYVIAGVRPIPSHPELIEGVNSVALIGLESRIGPLSLVSQSFQMGERASDLVSETRFQPLGSRPSTNGVIEEFSTHPLPLTSSEEADGLTRQTLDPQAAERGRIDVVVARRWSPDSHPATSNEPWWRQMVHIRRPTQHLVLDVWMPREMAASCVPAAAAQLWNPAMTGNPRRHWHDRIPGPLTVSVLGTPTNAPAPAAWPRGQALMARVFELAAWNVSDFVGHRYEIDYPILGASYDLIFEFASSQTPRNS